MSARDGSTVGRELALRPDFSTPSPNATNGAICATRREAGVTGFDCGAGAYGRYPTGPVVASQSDSPRGGSSPSPFRADRIDRREGLRTMTPMRQDLAAPAWLAPQDLSAAGQDAYDPQVAVDGQGNAIAVWSRSNATNLIVQAAAHAAGPHTAALAS
jgi:hypothetical protein